MPGHGAASHVSRASPWGCALTPAAWPWRGPREEARSGRAPHSRPGDLSFGKVRAGASLDRVDRERVGGVRGRRGCTGSCPVPRTGPRARRGGAGSCAALLASRLALTAGARPQTGGDGAAGAARGWGLSARQPGQGERRDGPSSATWALSNKFLRSRRVILPTPQPQARDALRPGVADSAPRGRPSAAPLSAGLGRRVVGDVRKGQRPPLCPRPSSTRGLAPTAAAAAASPSRCERRRQVHPACPRTPPCPVSLTRPRADSKHGKLLRNSRCWYKSAFFFPPFFLKSSVQTHEDLNN